MTRRFLVPTLVLAACLPFADAFGATKAAEKLEKQLAKDKDASVRARAAWDLGQMGSTESVPALSAAMLQDSSGPVRANAAASLWKLGSASKPAIPDLKKALDDSYAPVVGNAAGALSKLGVPKTQLLPAYKRVLQGTDCESRVIGLKGLVNEVPPTDLFDHAWACSHSAEDSDDRSAAREVLRKLVSRKDRVLVPAMLDALRNVGNRDASDLTAGISQVEPAVKEAVPVLVTLLDSRNEKTPEDAVRALGRMGAAALPAVPDIIALLAAAKAPVDAREEAAQALGNIGPKAAKEAVPALIKAAEDKWPKVRKAALGALGEMGPAAKEAVPVLRAALKDPDTWISMEARNALFRVQPDKREEVADIMDKSRPVQKGDLFDDLSLLATTLPAQVPEVYELMIYDKFAFAEAPYPDSKTGRGKFKYEGGAVTGPEEESADDCKKKTLLSKVDFSIVPKLVQQAPGLLGAPSNKVTYVKLGGGMFCKNIHWIVYVNDAGMVMFKLDGKVDKVQKM